MALLREARRHGDWLIVGVLSDETAASYKRRPIMSLAERVAVIEDAPFELTDAFLREHGITMVVHGDDLTAQGAEAVYGAAAAAGKLTLVPRTADVADPEYGDRLFVHETAPPSFGCLPEGLYGRRTLLPPPIRLSLRGAGIAAMFLASAVLRPELALRGYLRLPDGPRIRRLLLCHARL